MARELFSLGVGEIAIARSMEPRKQHLGCTFLLAPIERSHRRYRILKHFRHDSFYHASL